MKRWTEKEFNHLREMAAAGEYASAIAAKLGTSRASILTMAGRNGVEVLRYTPEEQDEMDRRRRESDRRKLERRRGRKRERTAAQRGSTIIIDPTASRTSAAYRSRLAPLPEMTKNELRAMLAQAIRNTAEISI